MLIRGWKAVQGPPFLPLGLLLVGDGTERKACESLVAELGLEKTVVFMG